MDLYGRINDLKTKMDGQKLKDDLMIYCLYCQDIHPPVPDDCKLKKMIEGKEKSE